VRKPPLAASVKSKYAVRPQIGFQGPVSYFGKEAQKMGSALKNHHANREWEIGEVVRFSVEAIPVQLEASARDGFSEIKPLAEEALTTLAALERCRRLTDKEHRQADALQRLLAALQ